MIDWNLDFCAEKSDNNSLKSSIITFFHWYAQKLRMEQETYQLTFNIGISFLHPRTCVKKGYQQILKRPNKSLSTNLKNLSDTSINTCKECILLISWISWSHRYDPGEAMTYFLQEHPLMTHAGPVKTNDQLQFWYIWNGKENVTAKHL